MFGESQTATGTYRDMRRLLFIFDQVSAVSVMGVVRAFLKGSENRPS